jgi:hypothetical protein
VLTSCQASDIALVIKALFDGLLICQRAKRSAATFGKPSSLKEFRNFPLCLIQNLTTNILSKTDE